MTDLLVLVTSPCGIEKVKEWFNASNRPLVFSRFLNLLWQKELTPLGDIETEGGFTPDGRRRTVLDWVKELFKSVPNFR